MGRETDRNRRVPRVAAAALIAAAAACFGCAGAPPVGSGGPPGGAAAGPAIDAVPGVPPPGSGTSRAASETLPAAAASRAPLAPGPADLRATRTASPLASSAPGAKAAAPTDEPGDAGETEEAAREAVAAALGRPGRLHDGVYTVTVDRADLGITLAGNDVPPGAGVASEFHFYRCPCGRTNVIGSFVAADFEANDVIDALRAGHVEIASVGPLLLHERPRLVLIRFQGEAHRAGELAATLRAAMGWTGKERMAPRPADGNGDDGGPQP